MAETQAVSTVNLASLQRAQEESGGPASPMSKIHTLKIYNPKIGEKADPEKDQKFIMKLADGKGDVMFEGPIVFSPLDVKVFYAGSIYPIDPNTGIRSADQVFFYTNEFGKYAKKTDVIGLAAKGKPLGFFEKGAFEQMIRAPRMNGAINQFYLSRKDSKNVPYDSSELVRKFMLYGVFTVGEYAGECFRIAVTPNAFGITFKDGENVEPEPGTFESVFPEALVDMNKLLTANNLRTVNRVEPDQVDVSLQIVQNDRQNNLPYFGYEGLVAARNGDNLESRTYVRQIQKEQFEHTFVAIDIPSAVLVENGDAKVQIQAPAASHKQPQLASATETITADDVEEAFGETVEEPTVSVPKDPKSSLMKPPF